MEILSASDYLKTLLREKSKLSIRQLAKKMGFKSDRSLGMILNGQRFLSMATFERIDRALSLNPREKNVLHLLIRRETNLRNKISVEGIESELNSIFRRKKVVRKTLDNSSLRALC